MSFRFLIQLPLTPKLNRRETETAEKIKFDLYCAFLGGLGVSAVRP
jgi:hypothetical protein